MRVYVYRLWPTRNVVGVALVAYIIPHVTMLSHGIKQASVTNSSQVPLRSTSSGIPGPVWRKPKRAVGVSNKESCSGLSNTNFEKFFFFIKVINLAAIPSQRCTSSGLVGI